MGSVLTLEVQDAYGVQRTHTHRHGPLGSGGRSGRRVSDSFYFPSLWCLFGVRR